MMENVSVKKEIYESSSVSHTGSQGDFQGPVINSAIDPMDVLPSEKELYCDIPIKSEEIHLPDCITNSEEMHPFDYNPEEVNLPDCTVNRLEVQLCDQIVNPGEMQPLDCTISCDKRQLLNGSINPGEMQPLDCITNQKVMQLQDCQINQEKNQLYHNKLKSENIYVPFKRTVEQLYIQPFKLNIKSEKIEVIEISDDSNDSVCTLSLESQEQTQSGIENVRSLKPPEPSVAEDLTFSPEKMKIIPGKLGRCGDCDFLSMDLNRCFRCRRELPPDCTIVDAEDAITQVLDKSKTDISDPQFTVKDIAPAAVQERLPITAPARKTHLKSKKHKPAIVKYVPGKLAVCPYCGCLSMNFSRCSQPRCRRNLPYGCLAIDAPESSRKKPSPETREKIVSESEKPKRGLQSLQKPKRDPKPSSNQPYQCNECPFVSSCRKSYLYHKQFHRSRSGATAVYKCPQCSYNVTHERLLTQHIKLHLKVGRSAPVTAGVREAASAQESLGKKTNSASALRGPNPSSIRSKEGPHKSVKQPTAINLKRIRGKLTMCPHCNRLSANPIRCSRGYCRKALRVDRKVKDESQKRVPIKSGAVFRCGECPFVNFNKTKYVHHMKLHRPGGSERFKCTMCSYNVAKRFNLIQHYKIHGSDLSSSHSTATSASGSDTKHPRSKRSVRQSVVSYAEADSTDDEDDQGMSEIKNKAVASERKNETATPLKNQLTTPLRNERVTHVRNESSREDDPNEWEFVSSNEKLQEDDGKQVFSDEVIFCYDCELSWKETCAKHGALVAVEDTDVPIDVDDDVFAIRTAPSRVRIGNSETPGKAKGIFARETLPSRLRFGPLKGKLGPPSGINSYTWLVRKNGKPFLCVDLSEPGTSCWLRYLRVAKNVAEMNCAAHQYQGRIYVTTIRQISSQEELLVGPYDHNGLLMKYDPDLVKNPKVSSWVSRSLKKKSEERRRSVKESSIGTKINTQPFSSVSTSPTFNVGKEKKELSLRCHFSNTTCPDQISLGANLRTHRGLKPYVCPECGWKLRTKCALALHTKRQHSNRASAKPTSSAHAGKQSFLCNVCHQSFRYSFALKKHRCAPVNGKPFKCSECSEQFSDKSNLGVHLRVHTGGKIYMCNDCDEPFAHESHLKRHSFIHAGEKNLDVTESSVQLSRKDDVMHTLVSNVCTQSFTEEADLRAHSSIHEHEKPFKCNVCTRKFSLRAHLANHLRSHTSASANQYVCKVCGLGFSRVIALQIHSRTHKNAKSSDVLEGCGQMSENNGMTQRHSRFACSMCSDVFHSERALKAHSRFHLKERPFECKICYKRYGQKDTLMKHHLTHKEKSFQCKTCSKWFSRSDQLALHNRRLHSGGKTFTCTMCDQQFTEKYDLMVHVKSQHKGKQSYVCKVCNEDFSRPTALQIHSRIHVTRESQFACSECPKRYQHKRHLLSHLRTHTGFKPFHCNECSSSFSTNYNLRLHKLTHSGVISCIECKEQFPHINNFITHQCSQKGTTSLESGAKSKTLHGPSQSITEKPFSCSRCPKRFIVKSKLEAHESWHTGVKPFACDHCPQTFAHISQVEGHVHKSHTGLNQYFKPTEPSDPTPPQNEDVDGEPPKMDQSPVSPMMYTIQINPPNKMKVREGKKSLECPICPRILASEKILRKHVMTHARRN